MLKRILIIFLLVFIQYVFISDVKAESHIGKLNLYGTQTEITYLAIDNNKYFPLKNIANELGINTVWDSKSNIVTITYPDKSEAKLLIANKQLLKESLYTSFNFIIENNRIYIEENNIPDIFEYSYFWNDKTGILYIYQYSYPEEGESILDKQINNEITIRDNKIEFIEDGIVKGNWSMNGLLQDVRLIDKKQVADTIEYKYAAFYLTDVNKLSQLLFTLRRLPNQDYILFVRAYSAANNQFMTHDILQSDNIFGNTAYIYKKQGNYHTLKEKADYDNINRYLLKYGESLDIWYIFAEDTLAIYDRYIQRIWEVSRNYHQTNAWMTPEGTYRGTPAGYQQKINYKNFNINLQASSPLQLMELLEVMDCRLFESIVHSAKYTLLEMRGIDGNWRTNISVNYLNRAYQLGPNFIDTRMSVDASLFLLKYGLKYNDQEALKQAKNFKNYFKMLKDIGLIYEKNSTFLYPDYYSEKYNGKTLSSLNHSLYEMNYLYTLYNLTGDVEAKIIGDEILAFIDKTANRWVNNEGDLYYAISPIGIFYGEDYINITYMDLFTAKSILEYMGTESIGIDMLYHQKSEYIKQTNPIHIESMLTLEKIFVNFDKEIAKKGDIFLSYPLLEIKRDDTYDFAYFSYGTYYFLKGVESITYKDETVTLNPSIKYVIEITKDKWLVDTIK